MHRWLIGALLVGALVRLPGVAWGVNYPDGFTGHHPDEFTHVAIADALITRDGRATPAYPKALGAYVAAPYLVWYAAHGSFGGPRLHLPWTIGAGRLISVVFGVAAILIVFAIGRDALGDPRSGVAAAWLLALGGLHVTQSHFFVADVPAATWMLLAVWLLWRDLMRTAPDDHRALRWAAFAAGAAFALKLFVFVFPALAYAVFSRPGRLSRAVQAAGFMAAGVFVSSLGFDTPASFYRVLTEGINYPFEFDRLRGALLYAIQLPNILSLPLLALAIIGTIGLLTRLRQATRLARRHALIVFGSVPVIGIAFILLKLDHFPRHLVFLIPWAAIAGGWALVQISDRLRRRGRGPWLILAPVFLWMLAFVIDGERFFIVEPRNDALRWVQANIPPGRSVNWTRHPTPRGYERARWPVPPDAPDQVEPDVLVVEMYDANHFLSGINWRHSYPSDPRVIFDGQSDARVAAVQGLFRGTSNYVEAARFPDAYLMPEYRLTNALLGDRTRSYITEVVVFVRRPS